MVAEADESDASFLELAPEIAVITNVELDHHSRWGSRAELLEAFERFAGRGRRRPRPARRRRARPDRRGAPRAGRCASTPSGPGPAGSTLAGPGPPQPAQRARGARARSSSPGSTLEPAARGARGASRGSCAARSARAARGGAEIYDDYAHHPTEVAATLEALRELEPRRLIAVFQPHLYSRTKALAGRFGAALAAADEIGVLDVYAAREQPVGELAGVSGLDVARAAADRAGGRPVLVAARRRDRRARAAPRACAQGDLLVTIGAGDVFTARRARWWRTP